MSAIRFDFVMSSLLALAIFLNAGCQPSRIGQENQTGSEKNSPQTKNDAVSRENADGTTNLQAEKPLVFQITTDMVSLYPFCPKLETVDQGQVGNVRDQFYGPIDWMDQLQPDQLASLQKATEELDQLLEKIRKDPGFANQAGMQPLVDKIQADNDKLQAAW